MHGKIHILFAKYVKKNILKKKCYGKCIYTLLHFFFFSKYLFFNRIWLGIHIFEITFSDNITKIEFGFPILCLNNWIRVEKYLYVMFSFEFMFFGYLREKKIAFCHHIYYTVDSTMQYYFCNIHFHIESQTSFNQKWGEQKTGFSWVDLLLRC